MYKRKSSQEEREDFEARPPSSTIGGQLTTTVCPPLFSPAPSTWRRGAWQRVCRLGTWCPFVRRSVRRYVGSSDDRAALDRRSGRAGRRKQGKKGEAAGFRTTPGTEEEERCGRRAPGHLRNNCTYKMKIYLFSPLILCVLRRWSQLSGSRGVTTGCQGFGIVGDATGGRSQKRTQARTQAARAFRPSATSEFLPTPHQPMTTNPSQRH